MRPERRRLSLLLLLALPLLPLAWWLFGPRGVAVQVERKNWRLEIEVERLVLESESGWCDELPAQAGAISRRLLADPSGARLAPSEHCRYTLPRWRLQYTLSAEGEPASPPQWPQAQLSALPATQIGAERLGKRRSFHEVQLRSATDQRWTCRLPLPVWQRIEAGSRLRLAVNRQGVADCAGLGTS